MLKVLTQYQGATGDRRIIPRSSVIFSYQCGADQASTARLGKFRWQDEASVVWLYNRTGEPSCWSWHRLLHTQGYDWKAQYANFNHETDHRDYIKLEEGGGLKILHCRRMA